MTYSSDYFQDLYDLAIRLIQSGNAYVCHQTADEISKSRCVPSKALKTVRRAPCMQQRYCCVPMQRGEDS